jgi:hypothetical protein
MTGRLRPSGLPFHPRLLLLRPSPVGQSGNPRGRPRKWARVPQGEFTHAIRIKLDITPAGAAELCRRGLVTLGFHLVGDVIDRVPKLGERAAYAKQAIRDRLIDHREYICRYGDDMPEIKNWTWGRQGAAQGATSTEGDNV